MRAGLRRSSMYASISSIILMPREESSASPPCRGTIIPRTLRHMTSMAAHGAVFPCIMCINLFHSRWLRGTCRRHPKAFAGSQAFRPPMYPSRRVGPPPLTPRPRWLRLQPQSPLPHQNVPGAYHGGGNCRVSVSGPGEGGSEERQAMGTGEAGKGIDRVRRGGEAVP